ncbi:MAG: flavin reductase [Gammaproteobacteria bacterium]
MTASVPIDSREFRSALGTFTTGVTIVTTRDQAGSDIGLTANSFNSVSLDPPMVLWSLARSSLSLEAFRNAEYFAVHILAADQQGLSDLFARRGADKFAGLDLKRGEGGVPLIEGCAARFLCRTTFVYEGGDHEIFVGEVVTFDHFDRPPLVFHGGRYTRVVAKPGSREPEAAARDADASFSRDYLGYLLNLAAHQMFLRLRAEYQKLGLSEDEYFLLSILSHGDDRSIEEMEPLFQFGRRVLTDALVDAMAARNLVVASAGSGPQRRIRLLPDGRRLTVQTAAITKALESEAEAGLDYEQARLLKDLVRQVIRNTRSSEVPPLTRRK